MNHIIQSIKIIFLNKTYSALNIAGLTIGITVTALILLWVEYQVNDNRSVPKIKYIHELHQNQRYGDDVRTFRVASTGLYNRIGNEIPGIRSISRYENGRSLTFTFEDEDKSMVWAGWYADSTLFSMIDLPFTSGNRETAFMPAHPVVISQSMAKSFFGDDDPVGKTLKANNILYAVTGVFKDREINGSFRFNWLIPFRLYEAERAVNNIPEWGNWFKCFIEIEPRANLANINANLTRIWADNATWGNDTEIFIYPVKSQRLYGVFENGKPAGGFITTVRMFFWIGLVVLVISCINFVNLSIARSRKRTLEVGLRKTFGARRISFVFQFMGESAIIVFIALALSVWLVLLCLPSFNTLVSLTLAIDIANPYHTGGFLAVGLLCTLLSGAYPAFYLSAFSPVNTLKKLKTVIPGSAVLVRKSLVVFQFTASFVLVSFIMIIYLQIRHLNHRPMGMDLEHLVYFRATEQIKRLLGPVQEQIVSTGYASHAGLSNHQMINIGNNAGGYNWQGKAPNVDPLVYQVNVSPGLLETLGIRFIEGSDFDYRYYGENRIDGVIINRSFANIMGEEGRVGGYFLWNNGNTTPIIGIIEDFVFGNVSRENAEPVIIRPDYSGSNNLFVRLKPDFPISEAIAGIQSALQTFSPEASFEPVFMDEVFNSMFRSERYTNKLVTLFAVLAVVLSCMGLFGLSAFAAEQRTREIGIRKVLGASTWSIVRLLGINFMQMLIVAFVIAVPVTWYFGQRWLQDYGYRITLEWYIFAAAGLLVVVVAMLTVSVQSLKAATTNPVKAIKSE